MRSLFFTFLLAMVAVLVIAAAVWQWHEGNFNTVFGAPPVAVGERVYDDFKPEDVKHIRVNANGVSATFSLGMNGWQTTAPWADRMDPRAAVALIQFTLGLRVEDYADVEKVDPQKSGLTKNAVNIRLESADHSPLAKFNLGRVTPWKAEVEGMDQPVATVYVQPRDKSRKRYVYSCTGDIASLFKDGLRFLRDHHPFYFNPTKVKMIRIRAQQGDLTLGRDDPKSPWRIIKPIDLPTDVNAARALLEGLYELQALKVSDRSESAQSPKDKAVKTNQIGLVMFGSEQEVLLDMAAPDGPEAQTLKATVSDRPGAIFDLPVKPEVGFVTLANLPLTVNELRDPTLTHLHVPSLSAISIQSISGPEITISRQAKKPWMATVNGETGEANEENLYALLKAVTTGKAVGFVSDAATDFTPWGLDRPVIRLRFLAQDNQVLELRFGIDGKGHYYVNRLGTPTVMRVDPLLVTTIAVHSYEWRHARMWSLDKTNLQGITRKTGGKSELVLKYNFIDESWHAEMDGKEATGSLDPLKANYLLTTLEGLKVSRWLAADDGAAAVALVNPSLEFSVVEKVRDDEDNLKSIAIRNLVFAPASKDAVPGFYFGRVQGDRNPFLISREIYQKLAAEVLEKD